MTCGAVCRGDKAAGERHPTTRNMARMACTNTNTHTHTHKHNNTITEKKNKKKKQSGKTKNYQVPDLLAA